MSDPVGLIYAGLIITGGLVGYFKAGSTISLASGLGFGTAAGLAAHSNNNPMLLAISFALTLAMGHRFIQTGKMMPAGVVGILSLGIVIRCLLRQFH